MWLYNICGRPLSSALPSQSCDEVLQWLGVVWIQQCVLPAEEREVREKRVEVRVQAEQEGLAVVGPINVSQSPEQQQKHLLDQKHEACWERCPWMREKRRFKAETGATWCAVRSRVMWAHFTCFCGEDVFISQQVLNVWHGVVEVKRSRALQLPAMVVSPNIKPEHTTRCEFTQRGNNRIYVWCFQ